MMVFFCIGKGSLRLEGFALETVELLGTLATE